MKIHNTALNGLKRVVSSPHADKRGTFTRWFCDRELREVLGGRHIVQANHSCTLRSGAVRGLHYQSPPHAETKLIRCIRGRVFDVAVDLRQASDTFLEWYSCELSGDDQDMLIIPEGFAHGFQVLEAGSELLYLHTAHYAPESEKGLRFDDPALTIPWPVPPTDISERDAGHPLITESFVGLSVN